MLELSLYHLLTNSCHLIFLTLSLTVDTNSEVVHICSTLMPVGLTVYKLCLKKIIRTCENILCFKRCTHKIKIFIFGLKTQFYVIVSIKSISFSYLQLRFVCYKVLSVQPGDLSWKNFFFFDNGSFPK